MRVLSHFRGRWIMETCSYSHEAITVKYTTFFKQGDFIYEQVRNGFVKWNTKDDTWEIVDHIHTGEMVANPYYKEYKNGETNGEPAEVEIVYYPLKNEALEKGQITLALQPEECNDLMSIIREIEEKSKKWIYISEEEWSIFRVQIRIAVASWFLYVFDDIKIPERIAGLISIVGVSGGGKKRLLTFIRMFAYRPIYTLSSTRIPSTFRLVEPWGTATLLVDEADQKEGGSDAEWIQFFNSRYDGTPISRYNTQTGSNDVFRSFGLTAFALRRLPKDEGTISRMTKINATISPVVLPELAGAEMFEEFESIRNKLLYLRLKYYGKLKFVGSSGLPPEHSWRGKEVLTLIRILAQIDPEIDKDILQISQELTKREVQNLSQSWDGNIINEIFSFITNEDTHAETKKGALFFVKRFHDWDGKEKIIPLSLSMLAKSLNSTPTEIYRSIIQFKIETLDRFTIPGLKKQSRGVLGFRHLEDTDRIFTRYVIGYNHELLNYREQLKIDSLPQEEVSKNEVKYDMESIKAEIETIMANNGNMLSLSIFTSILNEKLKASYPQISSEELNEAFKTATKWSGFSFDYVAQTVSLEVMK